MKLLKPLILAYNQPDQFFQWYQVNQRFSGSVIQWFCGVLISVKTGQITTTKVAQCLPDYFQHCGS
jgi:hypothetical protein